MDFDQAARYRAVSGLWLGAAVVNVSFGSKAKGCDWLLTAKSSRSREAALDPQQ